MKAPAVLFTILFTISILVCGKNKSPLRGSSPDKSITVRLTVKEDGAAVYATQRDGQTLIADSKLGFIFKDQLALS
jgi:hypothetical protein